MLFTCYLLAASFASAFSDKSVLAFFAAKESKRFKVIINRFTKHFKVINPIKAVQNSAIAPRCTNKIIL